MAARLTDKRKKKIVADYLETESYNATAKKNGVCGQTVRRVIEESPGIAEKFKQKKEENTAEILEYMKKQSGRVCDIIDIGLDVLPEKIQQAKTATEVSTSMATVIERFTEAALRVEKLKAEVEKARREDRAQKLVEDDPITKSLKEERGNGLL